MPFKIQSSTLPAAIGAGAGGQEIHFNDFTHKLTFSGGGETAIALATFGEGDELTAARQWARAAHGFTAVEVEPFDAVSEADKRQAEADQEAADREASNTEAKRIIKDAKEQAAKMMKDAQAHGESLQAKADETLARANEVLQAAKDANAKADEARTAALAALKEAGVKPSVLQKLGLREG